LVVLATKTKEEQRLVLLVAHSGGSSNGSNNSSISSDGSDCSRSLLCGGNSRNAPFFHVTLYVAAMGCPPRSMQAHPQAALC